MFFIKKTKVFCFNKSDIKIKQKIVDKLQKILYTVACILVNNKRFFMSDKEKISNFTVFSDEELISLIRNGSGKAFDELADRFRKTVSSLARNYYSESLTQEDWFQEGMIGFILAVRTFDETKDVAFSTYASVCISNKLRSAWKKANSSSNAPLNDSIILDDSCIPPEKSPEENYIESESYRFFTENFFNELSETEKKVITCYLAGFSYSETANTLDMTEKAVDNALCRAKTKLKKAVKK